MRKSFLAVALVACLASVTEAQKQDTTKVQRPATSNQDTVSTSGCVKWSFWKNECLLTTVPRQKVDTLRCVDASVCKAKYDSLLKADSLARIQAASARRQVAQDSTKKVVQKSPPRPAAVSRRNAEPTMKVPVTKETVARVDTSWTTRYDTTIHIIERTIVKIDSLIVERTIMREDTVLLHHAKFSDEIPVVKQGGFPIWRTIGAVVTVLAGSCEVASRNYGSDPWKFNCFPGDNIDIKIKNTNENGMAASKRGVRIPLSLILRRP